VRTFFRSALVVVLSAALIGIGIPASAASSNPVSAPLGMILQADRAMVGADLTMGGATIYDGDRLETSSAGTLRARLGGPQLYLLQNTATQVHGLPNGFSASLTQGIVLASSAEGQTFQVLADGITIRPANSQPTVAQVTWLSPTQLALTATRGAIYVSMGDDSKTIEAGSSYRVEVAPDEANPQAPIHTGRNHLVWWVIAGVGVATAIILWRALESPSGL
jgi:hypothetical protein